MSEVFALIIACVLTGWMVFISTSITIDAEEIEKLNGYCKVNQGIDKVKYRRLGHK